MFGKKKKSKPRPNTRKPAKPADPAKAARQRKMMQLILGILAGALAVLGLAVGFNFLLDRAHQKNVPPISDVGITITTNASEKRTRLIV